VLQKSDVGATGREATMQIVEFAQGAAEVPHTHPGELIGYVLEGAFELDVAGKPKATHRAGDSFLIEGGRVHAAKNIAPGPSRVLATVILEKASRPARRRSRARRSGTLAYSGGIPPRAPGPGFRIIGLDTETAMPHALR